MVDHAGIDSEVQKRIDEVHARIASVSEGHRRWNRVEEAMDSAGEDAINLLDDVGRDQQAVAISGLLAAHERFDALLDLFRSDPRLADEARENDCERHYHMCRKLLEALALVGEQEKGNRPF